MTYKGGSRNFSKGGGGAEEENFERKMFVDTHINVTRGPWATSLTCENSSNQLTYMIIS